MNGMSRADRLRSTPCDEEGCGKPVQSFDPRLCAMHRRRLTKHGSTAETTTSRRNAALQAAWARLRTPEAMESGPCWIWSGSTNRTGYGQVSRNGEALAHRAAWVEVHGPIPEGLVVCHRCDVPGCFRPSHLFIGTHADNQADKIAKGRQFTAGARDGRIRLTDQQVEAIRTERSLGALLPDIAHRYGVSSTLVGLIVRGKRRAAPTGVSPAAPAVPRTETRSRSRARQEAS